MAQGHRRRGIWRLGATLLATGTATFGLAVSASATASPRAAARASTPTSAVFAEPPGAAPNYIFPFQPLQFFSINSDNQFEYLMYRPLYWFGNGNQPTLNASLSLASPPVYSNGGKTATLTMKNWKWSNGETVSATDVLFWMNMMKAEKQNWASYAPGTIPDDLANVTVNGSKVVFTLKSSVNDYWFTYNELSQITPMPMAWDVSSASQKPGAEACAKAKFASITTTGSANTPVSAAAKSCVAVFTYLSTQAGFNPANPKAANNSLSTYATNPLWAVVDGPWKLSQFNASGYAAFVPNKRYSGPVKPKLKSFIEKPFTSNEAEFNALVGKQVDFGYLPYEDLTAAAPSTSKSGPNNPRLKSWSLAPWYSWSINYFPYNFHSTGDNGQAGKIFSQLYFRQAFQSMINQPLYIRRLYKNYSFPTYGPVPTYPKNSFANSIDEKGVYPYNPTYAKKLLTSNGWTVKPGGTTVCGRATCTGGIPKGTPLNFSLQYRSGDQTLNNLMQDEVSSWSQIGIHVTTTSATFDTVLGNAVACPKGCSWEMEFWGGGWIYIPDYYPTGESLFQTGAGSNSGSYSDPTNDALIKATNVKPGLQTLYDYENYFARQVPIVFEPNEAYQLNEVAPGLKGVTANPLLAINPENWYWKS